MAEMTALPFDSKQAVALERLNEKRVNDPNALLAQFEQFMGKDGLASFMAELVEEQKTYYMNSAAEEQAKADAIDELPEKPLIEEAI